VVKGWMSRKCEEYWHSIHGSSKLRAFLKDPLLKKGGGLLNLSRNQLRIVMGLLTEH
jgi:hypothetical protein